MKTRFAFFVFLFFSIVVNAQSALTHSDYYIDPKGYLSQINNAHVTTGLLIDRTLFDSSPLLQTSGTGVVTTISSAGWVEIYDAVRFANLDTTLYPDVDTLGLGADLVYDSDRAHAIRVLDFSFNKIKSTALSSGDFIESAGHLLDQHSTLSSYDVERSFAASTFTQFIYGDDVKFYFSQFFFLTNRTSDTIVDMDVDLDDGSGYTDFDFGDYVTGHYDPDSEELEVTVRIVFENNTTHFQSTRYAHFSVFRKGSNDIPVPGALPLSAGGRAAVEADRTGYYPDPGTANAGVCYYRNPPNVRVCENRVMPPPESVFIWWHILYSPQNTNKTLLKRPLIVVDGFDPNDSRSYYSNQIEFDDDLPYRNDGRGLYELLNGDPSPWYSGENVSANMLEYLRYRGYDIVFVNFEHGDGDIPTNADNFREFLQDVLNGPSYRDEFTEEAILIGPSMGGIITRMALKQIENTPGAHHYVKAWFSFDAPHQGAYIPIGLQHNIKDLLALSIFDFGFGKAAKRKLMKAQETLNKPAAKQLLRAHYSQTTSQANPHPNFDALYGVSGSLTTLGYPTKTYNVGITNGGTQNLYSNDGSIITALRTEKAASTFATAQAWGNHNTAGSNLVSSVSEFIPAVNIESVSTENQVGYENAPGGFHTALYIFNFPSDNADKPVGDARATGNRRLSAATFISTSSALGMPISRATIYNTYQSYNSPNITPFDEVKAMATNEEHVTITPDTREYFIEKLDNMFTSFTTPMVRPSQDLSVTITKPVAYTAMETITFGGDGNSFIVDAAAIVNVNASVEITFKPGVHVKSGTTLRAKIKPIHLYDLNTGRTAAITRTGIDYSKTTAFVGAKHSYKSYEPQEKLIDVISMKVYPNPSSSELHLELPGIGNILGFKILSSLGKEIPYNDAKNLGVNIVDVSNLSPGVYIVEVKDQFHNAYRTKFVKR